MVLSFDVTERKHAEQEIHHLHAELINSEKRFRALFDNAKLAIFLSKPDGTLLETNEAASEMFQYSESEFKSIHRNALFEFTENQLAQILETRKQNKNFLVNW